MTVESFETPDGAGQDAGFETEGTQPAAPAAPAERTYRDSDMAAARRSWEQRAARERDAAVQAARAEWQRSQAPANPADPWSQFDPQVAKLLQDALDARVKPLNDELATYKQKQEDIAFRNDEAEIRSKYPDYAKNRAAVLEFAVANSITNIDTAYRAWKFDELSRFDEQAIRRDERGKYTKAKAAQAAGTPLAEGRGGGAPSTKTNFRGKDGKLDKDAMDAHAMEIIRAANE